MRSSSLTPDLSVTSTYRHGGQARPQLSGGRVLATAGGAE